ncbi:hypothetical protein SISSUDRAFT_1099453 [Sistotremastrum suecicum HHB10207 ss-3]|uniref:Uncharacterized protein n=1 Tax=Sistotremastrum suecicum HHB10207 ss-3 TaxID=1314776 RepID=A0A165X0Q8_9AGAM|nr:hypothetical protein SISSUDRAFT_1099453 [Sistotremastrum suecicum HHB10207 ss-3]
MPIIPGIPEYYETPAGNRVDGNSQDVFEMLAQFNAGQLNADQVTSWHHAYFWAFWAPIFPRSADLEAFWELHATCISGAAVIAFLEKAEFPPQYPLDEDPEMATVDIFLPELVAQDWIALQVGSGWFVEREDSCHGYAALSRRIPYIEGGTATRVTRLYKKIVDEPEWGYASVYRMDVVHTFDFRSNHPVLTFTECNEHSPTLYTRYLCIIVPPPPLEDTPPPESEMYDHDSLEFLRPLRPHLLHGRPRLNDPDLRIDIGLRTANGALTWYDRDGHTHVHHLLEIEVRDGHLIQRRI